MSVYTFSVVTEKSAAQKLWERFSPKRSLFDDWSFRECFTIAYPIAFHFIVGRHNREPIGLLPLQKNMETGVHEFYGGRFMEENRVFVVQGHETAIKEFYAAVPAPAQLEYISGEDAFTSTLPQLEPKYTLPLIGVTSVSDYVEKFFTGKSRGTMRKKLKQTEELALEIREGIDRDLDTLVTLNLKRHGADSSFHIPKRKETFEKLLTLSTAMPILLSFVTNGCVVGVSFSMRYGSGFFYLNAGTDVESIPNLGNAVIFHNIERAIRDGASYFDALIGDYGWKERWHFAKTPQYGYTVS